ncbi:hypothetical protein [Dokdonella sp.]|uniref:hypothetical protein n=1 Tax=Dokdonella sp. TaxID=2291710 RepID=UPI0027B9DEE8|nr:hypothetical protein [Dokdonella sp.]
MANARTQFDYLASYLQRRDERVRLGRIAMHHGLLFEHHPFVILYRNSVAFRVAGRALTQALALPGSTGFDPLKPDEPPPGKPGWVLVPAAHWAAWNRLAIDSMHCLQRAQDHHVSWRVPPPPPEPAPTPPPSTPKSLAERVAAIMKSGFSFGLAKSDH